MLWDLFKCKKIIGSLANYDDYDKAHKLSGYNLIFFFFLNPREKHVYTENEFPRACISSHRVVSVSSIIFVFNRLMSKGKCNNDHLNFIIIYGNV